MKPSARTLPFNPGDVVGGKYRIERVLGAGGMGVVVAATHVDLGQSVALKFILPDTLMGQGAVERFMREARAVAMLKSEHVAKVFDVGHDIKDGEDRPFMVLELLDGLDLAKLNKQKGPFAVADAVEYVLQACEALVEAHTAGIVHRDLKPQNIFVTRRLNGTPLVKVLDFGISKSIGPAAVGQLQLTDSQAVIGSPLYMAPEQMRSARMAEVRSDIWALGVILYELLGGQAPFDGETVTEVCIRVVNEAPPALEKLRPGLDPALVTAVMRCLEKDPSQRWQNVAQLATAIEPFARSTQQGSPIRPWRSFEDTLDSQSIRLPAPPPLSPDETGPSTAITMPTGEGALPIFVPPPEKAAAPSPLAVVKSAKNASLSPSPSSRPLVSTDVTWGQITTDPPPPSKRGRISFAKGLASGIAATVIAAVAIVAFALTREAPKSTVAPAAPPPVTTTLVSEPTPTPTTSIATVADLPSAAPTATETTSKKGASPPVVVGAPRSSAKAKPSAPASEPAPTQRPAEPVSPNGAPILR
jgi:serine/threonine protein kinase